MSSFARSTPAFNAVAQGVDASPLPLVHKNALQIHCYMLIVCTLMLAHLSGEH
jgi:hypothetical protein